MTSTKDPNRGEPTSAAPIGEDDARGTGPDSEADRDPRTLARPHPGRLITSVAIGTIAIAAMIWRVMS